MAEARSVGQQNAGVALLAQRMDMLGGSMDELKVIVKGLSDRIEALEKKEIGCQAMVVGRADTNMRRIEEHEISIREIKKWQDDAEKMLTRLNIAYSVLVFIGSALGISMIGLIWALVTGQAQVIFR